MWLLLITPQIWPYLQNESLSQKSVPNKTLVFNSLRANINLSLKPPPPPHYLNSFIIYLNSLNFSINFNYLVCNVPVDTRVDVCCKPRWLPGPRSCCLPMLQPAWLSSLILPQQKPSHKGFSLGVPKIMGGVASLHLKPCCYNTEAVTVEAR